MAAGDAPDQPVVTGVVDTFVAAKPAVPPSISVEVPANLSAVTTNVDMSPPAPAVSEPPSGASSAVNANPVIVDVPAGNVSAVVTVGGADLGTGTEDTPGGSAATTRRTAATETETETETAMPAATARAMAPATAATVTIPTRAGRTDGFHGLAHKK